MVRLTNKRTPYRENILCFNYILGFVTALFGITLISARMVAADSVIDSNSSAVISSGAEIDYPPFSIVNDAGEASGFSVELMRAALAAMGREVTFRTGTWSEVRGWLEQGEIQALPLVGRTPEREFRFDFTVPYMSLHGAIVIRKSETGINTLSDLRERRVAVMKGDNAEEFLRREDRDFDIHTTSTFETALHQLADGQYDAVVVQRLVALRLIQKTGLTELQVIDRPIEGFKQDFCFAVREGDRDTLALLNEGLAIVMADGTYRHLHAQWFAAMQLPSDRPIVVGGDRNFPPFEYLDENGHPSGYNVDLTRAIAREMGLNIEIRLGRWPERMDALRTRTIDVIQGMFYSTGRDQYFDFTPAHTVSHYVAVVRKGEGPAPQTIEALADKRIVVEHGDILHDFAIEHGLENQITIVGDQEEALRELAEGKHDCALVSRITVLFLIDKHGWTNLVTGKKPLLVSECCYAVANGQQALLAQFSEGLKALENSGEYRQIYDKWLGVYKKQPMSFLTALRYTAMIIIPLLLMFSAASIWNWTLHRKVVEKTKALQESEGYQRAVIACSPVALYTVDLDGNVLSWNHSAEKIFGWQAEEIMGKPLPIVPDDKRMEFDALRKQVLEEGGFFGRELLRSKKDGTSIPISLSVAPVRNDRNEVIGILGSAEDISERKKAEAEHEKLQSQFIQAQKMESVGRLAGGVAHDYNNMLSVIIGHAELALGKTAASDPLQEDLKEILGAAQRSADITRQLLAFARQQTIDPKITDLNEIVEGMLNMLRRLIGEDINLSWQPGPGEMMVLMDPSQLDQIMANLCVNARDAIGGVGKLTIETSHIHFDDDYCAVHAGFIPGDFIMLAVSDDGFGMNKDTLENIFEPFFTTKGVGEGTGLGLSTVFGIVKQNDGFINVYSELGKGTTFRIYLPSHAKEETRIKAPETQDIPVGHGETVLVVEDEASILSLIQKILDSLGYTVLAASTPGKAIALEEEHAGDIHLLITDVVMPEMNGRDLAKNLQTHYPALKVLFMSGYTANVIAHRGVLEEGVNFIQKPFSKQDLAIKVRMALES